MLDVFNIKASIDFKLMMPKMGDFDSVENTTRTELIQKGNYLENMVKVFDNFASEELLNDIMEK